MTSNGHAYFPGRAVINPDWTIVADGILVHKRIGDKQAEELSSKPNSFVRFPLRRVKISAAHRAWSLDSKIIKPGPSPNSIAALRKENNIAATSSIDLNNNKLQQDTPMLKSSQIRLKSHDTLEAFSQSGVEIPQTKLEHWVPAAPHEILASMFPNAKRTTNTSNESHPSFDTTAPSDETMKSSIADIFSRDDNDDYEESVFRRKSNKDSMQPFTAKLRKRPQTANPRVFRRSEQNVVSEEVSAQFYRAPAAASLGGAARQVRARVSSASPRIEIRELQKQQLPIRTTAAPTAANAIDGTASFIMGIKQQESVAQAASSYSAQNRITSEKTRRAGEGVAVSQPGAEGMVVKLMHRPADRAAASASLRGASDTSPIPISIRMRRAGGGALSKLSTTSSLAPAAHARLFGSKLKAMRSHLLNLTYADAPSQIREEQPPYAENGTGAVERSGQAPSRTEIPESKRHARGSLSSLDPAYIDPELRPVLLWPGSDGAHSLDWSRGRGLEAERWAAANADLLPILANELGDDGRRESLLDELNAHAQEDDKQDKEKGDVMSEVEESMIDEDGFLIYQKILVPSRHSRKEAKSRVAIPASSAAIREAAAGEIVDGRIQQLPSTWLPGQNDLQTEIGTVPPRASLSATHDDDGDEKLDEREEFDEEFGGGAVVADAKLDSSDEDEKQSGQEREDPTRGHGRDGGREADELSHSATDENNLSPNQQQAPPQDAKSAQVKTTHGTQGGHSYKDADHSWKNYNDYSFQSNITHGVKMKLSENEQRAKDRYDAKASRTFVQAKKAASGESQATARRLVDHVLEKEKETSKQRRLKVKAFLHDAVREDQASRLAHLERKPALDMDGGALATRHDLLLPSGTKAATGDKTEKIPDDESRFGPFALSNGEPRASNAMMKKLIGSTASKQTQAFANSISAIRSVPEESDEVAPELNEDEAFPFTKNTQLARPQSAVMANRSYDTKHYLAPSLAAANRPSSAMPYKVGTTSKLAENPNNRVEEKSVAPLTARAGQPQVVAIGGGGGLRVRPASAFAVSPKATAPSFAAKRPNLEVSTQSEIMQVMDPTSREQISYSKLTMQLMPTSASENVHLQNGYKTGSVTGQPRPLVAAAAAPAPAHAPAADPASKLSSLQANVSAGSASATAASDATSATVGANYAAADVHHLALQDSTLRVLRHPGLALTKDSQTASSEDAFASMVLPLPAKLHRHVPGYNLSEAFVSSLRQASGLSRGNDSIPGSALSPEEIAQRRSVWLPRTILRAPPAARRANDLDARKTNIPHRERPGTAGPRQTSKPLLIQSAPLGHTPYATFLLQTLALQQGSANQAQIQESAAIEVQDKAEVQGNFSASVLRAAKVRPNTAHVVSSSPNAISAGVAHKPLLQGDPNKSIRYGPLFQHSRLDFRHRLAAPDSTSHFAPGGRSPEADFGADESSRSRRSGAATSNISRTSAFDAATIREYQEAIKKPVSESLQAAFSVAVTSAMSTVAAEIKAALKEETRELSIESGAAQARDQSDSAPIVSNRIH